MARDVQITFDCADPAGLARFWAEALGYRLQDPPGGFESWEHALEAMGVPPEGRATRWERDCSDFWHREPGDTHNWLASLAEEARHGYAIKQDVADTMGVRLPAGTLYAVIGRLESRGRTADHRGREAGQVYPAMPACRRPARAWRSGRFFVVKRGSVGDADDQAILREKPGYRLSPRLCAGRVQ